MDALPIGIEPVKITPLFGGYCWLYKFDNGYGASVALHSGSYGHEEGLFELLLTQFPLRSSVSWKQPNERFIDSICASEPGGDDSGLWGWLTAEDVARILGVIRGYESPRVQILQRHHVSASWDGEPVSGSYIGNW